MKENYFVNILQFFRGLKVNISETFIYNAHKVYTFSRPF